MASGGATVSFAISSMNAGEVARSYSERLRAELDESDLIHEARCRIGKLCGCRGGQVIELVAVCSARCRKVSEGGSPNSPR